MTTDEEQVIRDRIGRGTPIDQQQLREDLALVLSELDTTRTRLNWALDLLSRALPHEHGLPRPLN